MATGADPAATTSAALIAQIAGGGDGARAAEAALCRRYAPRIRLYGGRHLRDPDAARDLTQIVLLGVVEAARAGRVREPEHLERFILGICRNTAIRLRQKADRIVPLEDDHLARLLVSEDDPEVGDDKALAGCLETLDARARSVVLLAYREDRSADEIAAALAITAGNARVIRHRALAALRSCLEAKDQSATEKR